MSEVNKYLNKFGKQVVQKVQNEIISENAIVTGNFLRSVNYNYNEMNNLSTIDIDWIWYGQYADYYHDLKFSNIIEDELNGTDFQNGLEDAAIIDADKIINDNIQNNY